MHKINLLTVSLDAGALLRAGEDDKLTSNKYWHIIGWYVCPKHSCTCICRCTIDNWSSPRNKLQSRCNRCQVICQSTVHVATYTLGQGTTHVSGGPSDGHVHLYFGVWLVVVNDKIFKLEVIDVSDLSPDLQLGEGTGGTLQLWRRDTRYTLHHPFSPPSPLLQAKMCGTSNWWLNWVVGVSLHVGRLGCLWWRIIVLIPQLLWPAWGMYISLGLGPSRAALGIHVTVLVRDN